MPWPRTSTRFLQLLSQCLAFYPIIKYKKEVLQKRVLQHLQRSLCRKEAIRTPDPYVPNVVRYQLRYFPIAPAKLVISYDMAKVFPYFFVLTSIVILGR